MICIALSFLATSAAAAEELIDSKAVTLLQRMSDTLNSAPTLRFTAHTLSDDFEPSGVKIKRGMMQEITLERPNRLHVHTRLDDGSSRVAWYDGKILTVALPAEQVYAQVDAPATIDELLDLLQERYDFYLPLADLLYTDLYAKIEPHLLSGIHYGERSVGNLALQHISFEATPGDLQLWVDTSEATLPRLMVVNFTALEGEPEWLIRLDHWELGEYVDPSVFEFHPGASWRRVELKER